MSSQAIRDADNLEELSSVAADELSKIFGLAPGVATLGRRSVREILQRAYSIGYDAAQSDATNGAFG